jgi:glutaredoxin
MMPMARRPTKLEFHEHRVTCPYCRKDIMIYSLMEIIIAARRTCPNCKREMMIDNGKAVRLSAEGEKKPPKQVRSRISKAKA